ncbi:MAG: hypothetical protein COV70_01765 [Parcubacteria group bacterium CG11_big_fil_rev_8_21_14_0_20_39_22]|nr:MAG: hypothetical protein COV70_01765 [Parcubacteria group bacterium CG11_big_fil_rev_8_21_14_0_20_39_22]
MKEDPIKAPPKKSNKTLSKDINITVSSGTIIKTVVVVTLLAFLFVIRDLVLVVLTSVVIASAIEPITRWFGKYKVSRLFSVIIIYFVGASIVAGLFYYFVPSLLKDTSSLISQIPRYVDTVALWNPGGVSDIGLEDQKGLVQGISEGIVRSEQVISSGELSIGEAVNNVSKALNNVSEGFLQAISIIFGGILSFILIIVLSFYLAVQEDGIAKFLRVITPSRHEEYVINLWRRSQIKIGFWLQGQLLLALLVGMLVFLGLTIIGVRNALFFAMLAGVFEIIPLFGPILAAIPAVFVAYTDGGVSLGLITVGLYLIIQQFENHLIYPLVVRKIVGVPPILVILALIAGAKLAGFLGILLSVPVAAALMEFFDDWEKRKSGENSPNF